MGGPSHLEGSGRPLRVLHLNTYDVSGGAARAAYRLHKGLRSAGVDSVMAVQTKASDDPSVIAATGTGAVVLSRLRAALDALPLRLYTGRERSPFSLAWMPDRVSRVVQSLTPDIVHLHWVAGGFLGIGSLRKLVRPIVWTLHDAWAFTGGCHIAGDCDGYLGRCGRCPQLRSRLSWDLARMSWERKARSWRDLRVAVAAPSRWLAERAGRSSLLQGRRVELVHNGLDLARYRPIDKAVARQLLGLQPDGLIALYAAVGGTVPSWKGFDLLADAARVLAASPLGASLQLLVLGETGEGEQTTGGLSTRRMGYLRDDVTLALAYSAADVFVAPSRQDNLPNTVMEALACGTPCVAFRIGGMPDLIDPGENGYLAEPFSPEDLAAGIKWVLEDKERWQALSRAARAKAVSKFDIEVVARQYMELYESVIDAAGKRAGGMV